MGRGLLRNLFDQYSDDENRLTNSLLQVLSRNSKIAREFVEFFMGEAPPKGVELNYSCLYLPGEVPTSLLDEDQLERRGYPDGWIFSSDFSWVVALETKVTAFLSTDQLKRHLAMARHLGARRPRLLVVTTHEQVPPPIRTLKDERTRWTNWPSIFAFFSQNADGWIEKEFLTYVRIAEARLMANGYDGPPLTKFTGIPFDSDHPYNVPEAKVLLRALVRQLRDELAKSTVPINRRIRRPAIAAPWDVIGFSFASTDEDFTRHPHLTIGIWPREAHIQLTLPNNAHQEYWRRVVEVSDAKLFGILSEVVKNMKRTRHRLRGGEWEPDLEIDIFQRHFHARRTGFYDGRLRFRLDTLLHGQRKINPEVKTLPHWLPALRYILSQTRKANFEFALRASFPIEHGSVSKKPSLVREMVEAAEAMQPLIAFLRSSK